MSDIHRTYEHKIICVIKSSISMHVRVVIEMKRVFEPYWCVIKFAHGSVISKQISFIPRSADVGEKMMDWKSSMIALDQNSRSIYVDAARLTLDSFFKETHCWYTGDNKLVG